jgi:acyl-coenzyme A synthetase/AMP-(fatty) acid ligase/thioesterase domain-containing protein
MSASKRETSELASLELGPSIFERFEAAARIFPDKPALVDGESTVTYAELRGRAMAVAAALDAAFPDTEVIGILLPHSVMFWTAILGCFVANRTYLALDIAHPTERNARIVTEARLAAVIITPDCDPDGTLLPIGVPRLDISALAPASTPREETRAPRDLRSPASILYTSGSTGHPKGIVNSEENLLARVLPYVDAGRLGHEDRFLTLSSPCTIAGTREGLSALVLGATLFICNLRRNGLSEVQQLIAREGVTVLNAVPGVLRALMPRNGRATADLRSLRLIRVGGEIVFWNDIEQFRRSTAQGCEIMIGFSSTEATGAQWVVPTAVSSNATCIPVGYALPGNRFIIVDDVGEPLPPGEVGELVVRSRHVALGYFRAGRYELGDIEQDPHDPDVRITRTGDLMRLQPNGLCEAYGRKDRQVKINGQRVEPAEAEAALRASPEVIDAAAIVRSAGRTSWLEAFVVLAAAEPDSALAHVHESARAALPAYMCPTRLHLLPELPLRASGKLDTQALMRFAEQAEERRNDEAGDIGRANGAMLEAVHRVWGLVLGRSAPLQGTSFADCGGDSLRALEFVLLLEKALDRHLRVDLLSRDMEPSDIAATLQREPSLVLAAGERPTVFLFPGMYGDDLRLASLRVALESRIRFILVNYPGWPEMAAAARPGETIVNAALAQIIQTSPARSVALVGYSYGGRVALQVAQRLMGMGYAVSLLGILDTFIADEAHIESAVSPRGPGGDLSLQPRRQPLASRLRYHRERIAESFAFGGMAGVAGLAAAQFARHVVGFRVAGQTMRLWRPLLTHRSLLALDQWLQRFLRSAAREEWRAPPNSAPLPIRTLLFAADGHAPGTPGDLGWGTRCAMPQVVRVSGDHLTMLNRPHRDPLCEHLVAALQETY